MVWWRFVQCAHIIIFFFFFLTFVTHSSKSTTTATLCEYRTVPVHTATDKTRFECVNHQRSSDGLVLCTSSKIETRERGETVVGTSAAQLLGAVGTSFVAVG